ncbi:MAG: molybdopterin adenylyltransferase [Holophagaceae bacterium]|nr:molybdopterin adenylyltransferase [Holophagaceae bacterium]
MDTSIRIGIVTISDRAFRGEYEDLSGPAIATALNEYLTSDWQAIRRVIPDEQGFIEEVLKELCDAEGCCLVLTTGGTGPAKRDVTPEATVAVCDRVLDGFGEQMRAVSLRHVPTAILSRQIAGTRGRSLIINLPGKPSSIRECLDAVFPAVPYCIDLIEGPRLEADENAISVFRPKLGVAKNP